MASDSSASTSPMVLTPESTGSSPDPRKTKRQTTAFYGSGNLGNKPVKPFSRSAAKRESVMALGSIEHLQHYFTKAGIASRKNPLEKAQYGLVPAIGGKAHVPSVPSLGSISEFPLPPSPPSPPSRQSLEPHVKSYEIDPDCLLPGVCEDLSSVARVWQIDPQGPTQAVSSQPQQPLDILDVLKSTTRAIRSVRNYLLSLPDEEAGTIRAKFRAGILGPGGPGSVMTSSSLSSSSPSSSSTPAAAANQRDRYSDPLAKIRRSALEVLSVLRAVEEKCRIPLSDDAYDAQSDGGGGGARGDPHSQYTSPNVPVKDLPPASAATDEVRGASPEPPRPIVDPDASFSYSLVQVNGRYQQIPVWEEEEDVFQVQEEEEKEKRERWDERLVLAGGWLYKQDVTLSDLESERKTVSGYLDIVDEVLFEALPGSERGWERQRRKYQARPASLVNKTRRVSAGDGEGRMFGSSSLGIDNGGYQRRVSTGLVDMLQSMVLTEEPEDMVQFPQSQEPEEIIEDDLLPEWARRAMFVDDDLGRAHAILSTFLPKDLLVNLQLPEPSHAFLDCLSSGQLLCVAYNAIVRKSKKPLGYISKDSIHDIFALEKADKEVASPGSKKGWTFRRTDNLRLWVGALKLRYLLPVQVPSQIFKPITGFGLPTPPSLPEISRQSPTHTEDPSVIFFDAKVVARKGEGWENMLRSVLVLWIQKVVDERRLYH